ncbi:MAG: phenylalanine--tRNA ligase subunit beta [Candidatus Zixiibacteriota bacterium]
MKLSYNWLRELSGLDWPVEEMADRLTLCGTACEDIESTSRYMDKVVVGRVVELTAIEGADKIRKAIVDVGDSQLTLVCGAPNVAVGQYVPVALAGAKLLGDVTIKKTKIRGIESSGMICSERELAISDDHAGIMVLDPASRVGQGLVECLDYDDYIMTFELTPNRPDSMSAIGVARDLAALASTKVKRPKIALQESIDPTSKEISVRIDDPDACPRYAARVIRKVKVGQSPWWIQKRLLMSGLRPISNIVDITNLVLLESGHPLHAFDLDRFGSREVVVRCAADKEDFTTLDGKQHKLSPDVLLITNGKEGVAVGGIMGGLHSEVQADTVNILLEAAYFNPRVIRRGRKLIDVVTESSTRFEKGADPNDNLISSLNRAAYLMQELCGGEVSDGIVDCYPEPVNPMSIRFRPEKCNRILGINIEAERMAQIFADLEFSVLSTGSGVLEVTVPTFRPDIEREIDLVEEITRIVGYDSIPDSVSARGPQYTPKHFEDIFRSDVRHVLTGMGFDEMLGHGLADSGLATALHPDLRQVRIINPVSEDLDIMRNCMLLSGLTAVAHNLAHRNMDIALFEIGSVYFPPDASGKWVEEPRLLLAVTGQTDHTWRDRPREHDFYDLRGALDQLEAHFHFGQLQYEPTDVSYFESTASFRIVLSGQPLGVIGLLDTRTLKRAEIKQPVYIAELSIESLMSASDRLVAYSPLPVYPAAPRDLAMIVNQSVRAGDLVSTIESVAGGLAESVRIFDLYMGKQIEDGKKSVAIAISYRSPDGNLSSEEVDSVQSRVIESLKKQFDVVIRDK